MSAFFSFTFRSNEDFGQTFYRTNLKRVSKENSDNLLAASIKKNENSSTFDRFIAKMLSLRFGDFLYIYIYVYLIIICDHITSNLGDIFQKSRFARKSTGPTWTHIHIVMILVLK